MANFQEQKAIGKVFKRAKYQEVALKEGQGTAVQGTKSKLSSLDGSRTFVLNHAIQASIVFVALVGLPIFVGASSPMVAYLALNVTLKELFGHALQAVPTESTFVNVNGDLPWMEMYIHPTERGKLVGTLRLTVSLQISAAMLPLTLKTTTRPAFSSLESSLFGSEIHARWGKNGPSNMFKNIDLTIGLNVDRWTKCGVALRNLWASNSMSRPFESALFPQIPYYSAKTKRTLDFLAYVNCSSISLDNWDVFLPSHGFDTMWDNHKVMDLAEYHYKISHDQWKGFEHRGFNRSAHDDFSIFWDLLVNKTNNQTGQVTNGERETPLFITHYTIIRNAVGLKIEDATEHYDILNTLADIIRLPDGGFCPKRCWTFTQKMKRIWFELVDEDGNMLTSVDYVTLPDDALAASLRKAVKEEFKDSYLEGIAASDLTVFTNGVNGVNGVALAPQDSLAHIDETMTLVVQVPLPAFAVEVRGNLNRVQVQFATRELYYLFNNDLASRPL
ncbi:LOW QUALITY PROTEIN: Sulfatase-like protein [Phytophthora palmivora]|uniref:Sulfatase-like protein n=1 Tax=Phytophthora palmivora TaxID=4796 RepID=A0A2P4X747_9STRA|nr:LOW QUALITY PROTEIN: Sulfatase-like protein [Phytophthora palmivora]